MIPRIINGQWRIVYCGALEWVRRRGLANKPVNDTIYDSYEDASAYLDSLDAARYMF